MHYLVRRTRALRPILAIGCVWTMFATALGAYDPRPHRVNSTDDPFIPSVSEAWISPNGEWIVWIQRGSSPSLHRLYSARRWAGSTPIPLTPQIADASPTLQFWISPDSRFVAFQAKGVKNGWTEAWSIPIDGGSDASRLSPQVAWNPHVSMTLVGDRAVMTGYFNTQTVRELWSAPVDASAPAVQLNPKMAPGAPSIASMIWPRNETLLAFVMDSEDDGHLDLWLSPVDGSSAARRLNEVPGESTGVVPYSASFNFDGSWILYQESGATDEGEIWSAPVDLLGKARRITPAGYWDVDAFTESSAGIARALLVADSDGDSREEIWSVPVEGPPASAVRLAEAAVDFGFIDSYSFHFDGKEENVVFRGRLENVDHQEIWRAPADGLEPASRLSPPVQHAFAAYSILYPPIEGESTTIIQGNFLTRDDIGIWKVAIDGSQPNLRLDVAPAQGVVWQPFGRSADYVVYADFEPPDSSSVWIVEPSLPVTPTRLSEPRPSPWVISSIRSTPNRQRVVYLGEPGTIIGQEAFAVPVEGPAEASVRLNPELPDGGLVIEIVTISPDSEGVLFLAEIDGVFGGELWLSDSMVFKADFEEGDVSEWSLANAGK